MMLFLLLLNIVFLRFPFGVLPPGDYLPAPVEPVFDALFDIPPVLETVFGINTLEASKVADVFPPEPLPGHGQYISHLTNNHDATSTGQLATPTGTSTTSEVTLTPTSAQDSDSSGTPRLARPDGVEFLSMRDSAATEGYVDRNVLYDLKTRDVGKTPFLTYSTFEIFVISVRGCVASTLIVIGFYRATAMFLVGLCRTVMIGRAKFKKHRQRVRSEKERTKQYDELLEDASYYCSEAHDANRKLGECQTELAQCQTELAKLKQTRKQNRSEHSDLQRQYIDLEKELAEVTQEAREREATHAQELLEATQQKISLESDQKAQCALIDEQAQALKDEDAELVKYKAQAKEAEKLDIDMQKLESALQKKDTELSSYKVKAHKADKLEESLQRLQNGQKNRDACMERLSKENKAFKTSEARLQAEIASLKKEKADTALESDRQNKAFKEREEILNAQVSDLTKQKADAMLEADRERSSRLKAEDALVSDTVQSKNSKAKLQEQVASLTKERDDAILKADRERSIREKAKDTSRSKANQLKKDLAQSKEETAVCKKDMEQMKADAEEQKKHAAFMDGIKKHNLQSNPSRIENMVDSIDNTVQKNRELVKRFEKEREERMAASPWHNGLASSDKKDVAQGDNLLETKTEEVSLVDFAPDSPRPDSDQSFGVPRQSPSPTDQSTDSGFFEEIKSRIDQSPSTVDAPTIPETFSADRILESENELQVRFPETDVDISAPQETLQSQTLSNLLCPQHNLEAKTMLPQGISVLQLAQTVIVRQTKSTVFIADDLRRREPWLRKEAKAYKNGSLRARKNWHKETIAASVEDLGLKFAPKKEDNDENLKPGQKPFIQLPNFKGSRRRHSLSYGEKDSVIMAKIKNPRIPRTDTREVPWKSAWLSSNVLEEISTRASSRPTSSVDDTLHLKSIMLKGDLNTVPASALLRLTDDFFTTASRDSKQLSTVPRNDASYDEFGSASILDIVGADNLRLMRQKLAYAGSFSSFVDGVTFDKYRSTWSQAKEIRVESFFDKNQAKISNHLPATPRFDYSTESVHELLAATADVADEDVVRIAQENERPKSFASDINYLRHSGSTGIDAHYEKERAHEARNTVNAPSAPPSLSNPSSITTTTVNAGPSAPLAPFPLVPPVQPALPAPSRGVESSQQATAAPTPPGSSPAAQFAAQATPTTTAAPPRSLNSSRHASITPALLTSPAVEADTAPTTNAAPLRGLNVSRFATNDTTATSSTNAPSGDSGATTSDTPSLSLNESRWARETPTRPSTAAPSGPRILGQNIPTGPRNHRGGRGYGRGGRGWGRGGGFR